MAIQTRTALKTYFNTGDKPTETQFANLIDSGLNLTDGGTVAGIAVFSSHITASGNISASGTIFANSFQSTTGEELDLTSTATIDINAVTVDIDASDNITLDAADDISLTTSTADGLITLHSAHTAGQAILIDANANAGSILDIDAGIIDIDVQAGTTLNTTSLTVTSATGTAAGTGIDTVSPTVNVSTIGRDIVTEVFIDIGAGLILSSGGEGDVIGEDGLANAFVTKMTTAINGLIYAGEVVCLEVPTTGDPDVNVVAHETGTIAEDADGETGNHHVLANSGVHTLALKTAFTIPSGGIQDDFIYLTHGGTTAGTYDAGKFLLRFFGTPTS